MKPNHRWDNYFLSLAAATGSMSKDPSTKVGAVIVGPKREIRCTGFNGFPRGIADDKRLNDRELKLKLVVHAEENCICAAARVGASLEGCTLYLATAENSPKHWEGPPCTRCCVSLIQSGIARIVTRNTGVPRPEWQSDNELSFKLLAEAGIIYSAYLK